MASSGKRNAGLLDDFDIEDVLFDDIESDDEDADPLFRYSESESDDDNELGEDTVQSEVEDEPEVGLPIGGFGDVNNRGRRRGQRRPRPILPPIVDEDWESCDENTPDFPLVTFHKSGFGFVPPTYPGYEPPPPTKPIAFSTCFL